MPRKKSGPQSSLSPYTAAVLARLVDRARLNVVIVGANDGRINDPLYPLISEHLVDRSRVVLFEPQPALIPYLEQNYAFHPDHHVVNGAIGAGPTLTLNAVHPDIWPRLQPSYAEGWPIYRAPTGVTSTDRDSVLDWLGRHLPPDISPDSAIETVTVPATTLTEALDARGLDGPTDILQIDAEGYDDQVIFHCDIPRHRPAVIHFESKMIPGDRKRALARHLGDLGYHWHNFGGDTMCLDLAPPT